MSNFTSLYVKYLLLYVGQMSQMEYVTKAILSHSNYMNLSQKSSYTKKWFSCPFQTPSSKGY